MSHAKPTLAGLLVACALLIAGCSRDPSTPEEKRAKGDELIRRMSASLAGAKTLTYTTSETRERMKGNQKVSARRSQQVTIRRPDRGHFKITGDDKDEEFWYDGKKVTFVSHKDKAWARGPMPPTLDEALDFVFTEYGVPVPIADFLYSSPYDALVAAGTAAGATGGWVARETIDGKACNHLSYHSPTTQWDLWLHDDERALPVRLKITHTQEPGQPATDITFVSGELEVAAPDAIFTAKVDESAYRRLHLVRAATAEPEPEPQPADPAKGAVQPADRPKQ